MDGKIDLERARRDAKALLRAARAGDAGALVRLPADRVPRLADAQRVVASDLGLPNWPALLREVEGQHRSPLRAAAIDGDVRAVSRLLDTGSDPNERDPVTGRTALLEAAARGRLDVVSRLVTWVPVDVRDRDDRGLNALETCLHGSRHAEDASTVAGYLAVSKVLVSNGLAARREFVTGAALPVRTWVEGRLATGRRQQVDDEHDDLACAMDVAWYTAVAGSGVAEVRPIGDGFAFRTGLFDNTCNGVVCSRLPEHTIEEDIADVVAWFDEWHVPARWLVDDGDASLHLREHLVSLGCEPERAAAYMRAPLGELPPTTTPADVEIAPVRTGADLAHTFDTLDVFDGDASQLGLAVRLHDVLDVRHGSGGPLRHWIARTDDRCVGLASVHIDAHAAELIDLGVVGSMRQRGVGRALTQHAFTMARADGCTTGILAPTAATVPFYEALGFELRRVPPDQAYYLPMADRARGST